MHDQHIPPGPPPANNLLDQIRLFRSFQQDSLGVFKRFKAEYGDIYALEINGIRNFIISDPDAMHEVMVTKANQFYKDRDLKDSERGLARFLGNGLLTSDGEFWRRQRKLAAPALHVRRIAAYAGTMVEYTSAMLNRWSDGANLDISREMTALTMKIVAKTLFNTDVSSEFERVGQAMDAVQSLGGSPSMLPTWIPTPYELRLRRAGRALDEIIYRIIAEWREEGVDRGDLLSMLLLAEDDDGKRMTDQQARDEVVTLFLAGHETTANTLNWTFMLLAQHPEVEAKLHAELDAVLAWARAHAGRSGEPALQRDGHQGIDALVSTRLDCRSPGYRGYRDRWLYGAKRRTDQSGLLSGTSRSALVATTRALYAGALQSSE
ncbi:MAG: cytochrome P450 [Anaerolineae bacterium]|nr:cytochrome P450 [Anaerolineae bacterium]